MKRNIFIIICIIFSILAVLCGIYAVTTLLKALTQPHLESAVREFHFLGYYIMSGSFGIGALMSGAIAILFGVVATQKKK